jgi:hypothetical protein
LLREIKALLVIFQDHYSSYSTDNLIFAAQKSLTVLADEVLGAVFATFGFRQDHYPVWIGSLRCYCR